MRIRRSWLLLLMLLVPSVARAHGHVADEFFGASLAFGSVLPGLHGTVSVPIGARSQTDPNGVKPLSLVGDLSFHDGSRDDSDLKHVNYMGGLRYTFAQAADQKPVVFVHALLGGGSLKRFGDWHADKALAIGGGFEYDWQPGLGFRVQLDYIVRPGEITPRVSAGIVLRQER